MFLVNSLDFTRDLEDNQGTVEVGPQDSDKAWSNFGISCRELPVVVDDDKGFVYLMNNELFYKVTIHLCKMRETLRVGRFRSFVE